MTNRERQLEHLLARREWANRWMAVDPANLPGTLTHEKIARVTIDTEVALVDFIVLSPSGLIYSA